MLRFFLIFLLVHVAPLYAGAPQNAMYNDPSPYLAMHGNDPVNWRHWNEKAIDEARKQNKLLFVSIGYFSCHWCHVMQKESYQNGEIAYLLNSNFISVKVDRELNPALDAKLIEFVERTRGYSGWPLNVFITPEGYPLLGLVYLPPADFKGLITELHSVWQKDAASLKADARGAALELAPQVPAPLDIKSDITTLARDRFVAAAMLNADQFLGGFGQQGKFPSVPQLMTLLNVQADRPDDSVEAFLRTTLDNMVNLGLHDQLGGGFFRYTVDPQWRVPHFEKMLYDNALLASLYFRAGEVFAEKRYIDTALTTVRFMRRELQTASGALAASLSALDDKGIEGGYYLWDKQELEKMLDAESYKLVEVTWALTGGPTTEEGYLPTLSVPVDSSEDRQRLKSIHETLYQQRKQRMLPRDDKLLAAWNGLAISAFVSAHRHDPQGKWLETARQVRDYLVKNLWDDNKLLRARDASGKPLGTVTLTDYVAVAEGLLDLSNVTNSKVDEQIARNMISKAWEGFVNEYGFRRTETSLLAIPQGEVILADSPIYSPSSQLLRLTLRAFARQHTLHKLARQVFANGQTLMLDDPYWFATQVDVALQYRSQLN